MARGERRQEEYYNGKSSGRAAGKSATRKKTKQKRKIALLVVELLVVETAQIGNGAPEHTDVVAEGD